MKAWRRVFYPLVIVVVALQFLPDARTNPPVVGEPAWDSEATRALVKRACFDCHSNETEWPWYARVAPISLLVVHDVNEGREHMNFSEPPFGDVDEAAEEVADGEMPLWIYTLAHPDARLSEAEQVALLAGLKATFGE